MRQMRLTRKCPGVSAGPPRGKLTQIIMKPLMTKKMSTPEAPKVVNQSGLFQDEAAPRGFFQRVMEDDENRGDTPQNLNARKRAAQWYQGGPLFRHGADTRVPAQALSDRRPSVNAAFRAERHQFHRPVSCLSRSVLPDGVD